MKNTQYAIRPGLPLANARAGNTQYEKGFTIIELIVVMVVLAVIAFIIVNIIYNATDSWQLIKLRKELTQQGRVAMERMTRQIRLIRNAQSMLIADARTISFVDISGATVTFSWSGAAGDSLLQNTNPLAENVLSFNLEYYDKNDNLISPILLPTTNIWRIVINLNLTRQGQAITLRSQAHPMNF